MNDEFFMRKALELASLGAGFTSPNPMVGAVIVNKGRIVGIGYHKKKGDKHAEIRAIEDAQGYLEGSTLYVNLEPCAHYGATPPCAPVIPQVGIKRVVISNLDPNPLVNGKGVQILKEQGVEVVTGVLEKEGEFLNRFFFKFMRTGLPYIIVKVASTLDGFLADAFGNSKWITQEDSRRYVHKLRGEVDAIMVGKGTVLKDDPLLTPREVFAPRMPFKIIVAKKPFPSYNYKVFDNPEKVIIVTSESSEWILPPELIERVKFIPVPKSDDRLDLNLALKKLGEFGIQSILCEGGSFLYSELLKNNLVDEIILFYAPIILGKGLSLFSGLEKTLDNGLRNFKVHETVNFENDVMVRLLRNG